MAASKRPTFLQRILRARAAANDAAAEPRRKNFELDQHRIDLVKEALGASTETEAITRAMDVALEMTAFAREVHNGSARMLGKGGFVDQFDDEASLDFGGWSASWSRSTLMPNALAQLQGRLIMRAKRAFRNALVGCSVR
jgi:hypothetical protein